MQSYPDYRYSQPIRDGELRSQHAPTALHSALFVHSTLVEKIVMEFLPSVVPQLHMLSLPWLYRCVIPAGHPRPRAGCRRLTLNDKNDRSFLDSGDRRVVLARSKSV